MDNNTRRYPRTSVEAFPKTVEYACPIEGYRKFNPLTWRQAAAIATVIIIFSVLFAALSKGLAS